MTIKAQINCNMLTVNNKDFQTDIRVYNKLRKKIKKIKKKKKEGKKERKKGNTKQKGIKERDVIINI